METNNHMLKIKFSKPYRNLFVTTLVISLIFSFYLSTMAASTPVNGLTSDQLFIIQGSGAPAASGDYISATDEGLNSYYTFYIEVPQGLSQLVVSIYDPDVGAGDTSDSNGNRDQIRTPSWNTCTRYRLYRPDGTQATSVVYGIRTGSPGSYSCTSRPVNSGDASWVNLASISNPARGHWRITVDSSSAVTTGDDVNAFGIRANDGTPGSGGTELNLYAESFFAFGDNINLPERFYTIYPYVTSGCQARMNDFDWDTSGTSAYGTLSLTSRTGAYTHTNSTMSGNDVWQNVQINPWTSDDNASDYGIWSSIVSILWYVRSGVNNNNYGLVYLGDYASSGGAPISSPQANTFRLYFPTDAGSAPIKPYLTQTYTTVSGPNPAQTGYTTQIRVNVQMINPTGSMGPITFSNINTIRAYVPGGEVVYADNATVTQGSVISQPSIGGSGEVVWNPGTVNSGTTATLTYDLNVIPTSAPKTINITGTPDTNGTRATYLDETGNTTQTRATYTFGPLCGLRINAEEPTAVTLLDFSVQPRSNQVTVLWQTAQEIDTLGFNILRSTSLAQEPLPVNSLMIPAQAMGSINPTTYSYVDQNVETGVVYYYWLQVDNIGEDQLFGPKEARTTFSVYLPTISKHNDADQSVYNLSPGE
jgi:hypothetical protein